MPPNARYCISFLHEMINEKLEDQWMADIRLKEYSYCTEETYVTWHKRFELWQGKRHSSEMATPEVEAFLTHLAVNLGFGGGLAEPSPQCTDLPLQEGAQDRLGWYRRQACEALQAPSGGSEHQRK